MGRPKKVKEEEPKSTEGVVTVTYNKHNGRIKFTMEGFDTTFQARLALQKAVRRVRVAAMNNGEYVGVGYDAGQPEEED